jgi:hypothetical protein
MAGRLSQTTRDQILGLLCAPLLDAALQVAARLRFVSIGSPGPFSVPLCLCLYARGIRIDGATRTSAKTVPTQKPTTPEPMKTGPKAHHLRGTLATWLSACFLGSVFGGLFDVTEALLHLPFNLLRNALYLLGRAASHLAYLLLHFSSNIFGCTFDLISIHRQLRLVGEVPHTAV